MENLVQPSDTSGEGVLHIEERAVRIGERRRSREPAGIDGGCIARHAHLLQHLHGAVRPHCPLAQQPAGNARRARTVTEWRKGGEQIEHDLIIVSGVERDVGAPGVRHRSHDLERLVAIERRDLDRDHLRNLREVAPEFVAKHAAADGGLQIETKQWKQLADGATVLEQLSLWRVVQRAEADERRVVSEVVREPRLGERLRRIAAHARDAREWARLGAQRCGGGLRREGEHRREEPVLRIADLELRSVHAYRDAAGARRHVVAGERALMALVERARGGESERMRGDHVPAREMASDVGHVQNAPERSSKWVGLPSRGFPERTQPATHSSSVLDETDGAPNIECASVALLSRASLASAPAKTGGRSRSSPRRVASARTVRISRPVTFTTKGGTLACARHRSAQSFALPCHITLT